MTTLLLGINHNTASVAIREKVAFAPELMREAIQQACQQAQLGELAILSTCNRTELYCVPDEEADTEAKREAIREAVLQWLATYHSLQVEELRSCIYVYWDAAAVEHVMKVASGLDSMVLGEPQILGQIKSAYAVAKEAGSINSELHRVFEDSFAIAKQVRTDTAIGENPVSVAFAAVSLAQQIFTDLATANALLIGAGHTIELVIQHLRQAGVRNMVVANRTLTHARELKRKYGISEVLLSDIPEQLAKADIVVSSTASQLPIVGKGTAERALKLRKHRPIFMVDLAVPRDIEPEVGELDDVYLYSVDDLRQVVDSNVKSREKAARDAKLIVQQGLAAFQEKQRSRHIVASLREFREKAGQLRDAEVEKALYALSKGADPEQLIRKLAHLLTNKLIHSPSVQLKKASAENRQDLVELARTLFELDSSDALAGDAEEQDS